MKNNIMIRMVEHNLQEVMSLEDIKELNNIMEKDTSECSYVTHMVKYIHDEMNNCECNYKMDKLAKLLSKVCNNENNKNIKQYSVSELLKEICASGDYASYNDQEYKNNLVRNIYNPESSKERKITFMMNINFKTLNAKGILNEDGTFTVLKGSKMTSECKGAYGKIQEKNIKSLAGIIDKCEGNSYVFIEDHVFNNYTRATECLKGYMGIRKGQWTNYLGDNIDEVFKNITTKLA